MNFVYGRPNIGVVFMYNGVPVEDLTIATQNDYLWGYEQASCSCHFTQDQNGDPGQLITNNWHGGENLFSKPWSSYTNTSGDAWTQSQLQPIEQAIQAVFLGHQKSLYTQIVADLSANQGILFTSVEEMNGDKKIFQAMASLFTPKSLSKNDAYRAMLFGNQGLPDQSLIAMKYTAALGNMNTAPGQDNSVDLKSYLDSSSKAVDGILVQLASSPVPLAGSETQPDIAATLDALEVLDGMTPPRRLNWIERLWRWLTGR